MEMQNTVNPLDVLRLLRSAGGALLAQAALHGQLARVEWKVEKQRLLKLCCASLLGFACLLCAMLFLGVAVLAYSWETAYRFHTLAALIVVYGIGVCIALRYMQKFLALGDQAFAATRAELAADAALIRSTL
jgi:uncharacterized membrane protein YqjE